MGFDDVFKLFRAKNTGKTQIGQSTSEFDELNQLDRIAPIWT